MKNILIFLVISIPINLILSLFLLSSVRGNLSSSHLSLDIVHFISGLVGTVLILTLYNKFRSREFDNTLSGYRRTLAAGIYFIIITFYSEIFIFVIALQKLGKCQGSIMDQVTCSNPFFEVLYSFAQTMGIVGLLPPLSLIGVLPRFYLGAYFFLSAFRQKKSIIPLILLSILSVILLTAVFVTFVKGVNVADYKENMQATTTQEVINTDRNLSTHDDTARNQNNVPLNTSQTVTANLTQEKSTPTIVTAYIAALTDTDITLDYINILSGEKAKDALIEDGHCGAAERDKCFDGNIEVYYRNNNPLLRTFKLSPDVRFVTTNGKEYTKKELQNLYPKTSDSYNYKLPHLYAQTISIDTNNMVIKAEDIFQP